MSDQTIRCCAEDTPDVDSADVARTTLRIPQMDCPTEERLIRDRLAGVRGVRKLTFDLPARQLTVEYAGGEVSPIMLALRDIGMAPAEGEADSCGQRSDPERAKVGGGHDCCGSRPSSPAAQSTMPRALRVAVFSIDDMDCPTEEKLIRDRLARERGVVDVNFNLMQRKLTVEHELDDVQPIVEALKGVGMNAQLIEPSPPQTGKKATYRIDNMDCPTEEALIRDKLSSIPGVKELEFNLMQRTLGVVHTLPSSEPIEKALAAIGMHAKWVAPFAGSQTTVLRIPQMDCPTEEKLIGDRLAALRGVESLQFNLLQRTLTVTHASDAREPLTAALKSIGFDSEIQSEQAPNAVQPPPRTNWWPMAVSGVAAVAAEGVYWYVAGNHFLVIAFALLAIFTGGLQTYKKGWIAVRNRNLNMNALMSMAVAGSGDGDVPVCSCRVDRSEVTRPRP
jgi:Zn2+/Cd2+-exporting ATPase